MEPLIVTGMKRLVIAGDDEIAWAAERIGGVVWPRDTQALAIYDGDELSAVTLYNMFMDASCSAHIATNGKRSWATRGMLYGIFAFPFLQLDLRRITAPIAASNKPAIINAINLGFQFEGRLIHARAHDDEIVMGMLREECIWIKETEHG